MKSKDILKRIMACIAALLITFSSVPSGIVLAAPGEGTPGDVQQEPVVTAELSSDKEYYGEDDTAELTLIVTGTDAEITADDISFYKNDAAEPDESVTVSVESDGVFKARIAIVGATGNISYKAVVALEGGESVEAEITLRVDADAPVIEITSDHSKWARGTVTITGKVTDAGSGVSSLMLDGVAQTFNESNGSFSITVSEGKEYTLTAKDNVGITSAPKTVEVKIDNDPPQIATRVEWAANGKIKVSVTGITDGSGSGIDGKVYYSTRELSESDYKNAESFEYSETNNSIELANDIYYFYCADNVGNLSAASKVASVDENPPEVTVKLSDDNWTKYDVEMTVEATDVESGVKAIYYGTEKLDEADLTEETLEERYTEYKGPVTVNSAATYYVYAVDYAGNVSEASTAVILIDKKAPVVSSVTVNDGNNDGWFGSGVTVKVEASDAGSGVAYIVYSTKELSKSEVVSGNTIAVDADGKCIIPADKIDELVADGEMIDTIYIYAVDNAGNVSDKTPESSAKLQIDKRTPVIEKVTAERNGIPGENIVLLEKILGKKAAFLIVEKITETLSSYLANNDISITVEVRNPNKNLGIDFISDFVNAAAVKIENSVEDEEIIKYTFTAPVTFDGDIGTASGYVQFTNELGFSSNKQDLTFTIDTTRPTVDVSELEHKINVVTLTYNNKGNENSETYYMYGDEESEKPRNGLELFEKSQQEGFKGGVYNGDPIGFKDKDNTPHKYIWFAAVDELGNISDLKEVRDTAAPEFAENGFKAEIIKKDGTTENYFDLGEDKFVGMDGDVQLSIVLSDNAGEGEFRSAVKLYCWTDKDEERKEVELTETKENHTYSATIDFTDEQNTTYYFQAVDEAGNQSGDTKEINIRIDKSTPEVEIEENSSKGNWTNANEVKVKASIKYKEGDSVKSGVSKILAVPTSDSKNATEQEVELNSDDTEYTFTFTDAQDAVYDIYVIDNAGNKSNVTQAVVKIERKLPEVTVKTNTSDQKWTKNDVTVTIEANDIADENGVVSGLAEVWAEAYIGTNGEDKEKHILTVNDNGEYSFTFKDEQQVTYRFFAKDNAGNVSEIHESAQSDVKIDKTAATFEITSSIDGKVAEDYSNPGWVKKGQTLTLSFDVKDISGDENNESRAPLTLTYWNENNDEEQELQLVPDKDNKYLYTAELVLDEDETTTYHFKLTDEAGNEAAEKTVNVMIDQTAPEVTSVENSSDGNWTNADEVTVKVTFKDIENNGIKSEVCKVLAVPTDKSLNATEQSFEFNGDGEYTFTFTAEQDAVYDIYVVDNAGNKSNVEQAVIKIERKLPEVKVKTNTSDQKWTKNNVTVTIEAKDIEDGNGVVSGLAEVWAEAYTGINGEDKELHILTANGNGEYSFTFTEEQDVIYSFYAKDTAGNVSKLTADAQSTVKIDKTPVSTNNVTIAVSESERYQFGIYHNKEITFTVNIKNAPTNNIKSNIYSVEMLNKNPGARSVTLKNTTDEDQTQWTFTIPMNKVYLKDIYYSNISFKITDQAGNVTEVSLADKLNYSGDALVDTQAPQIGEFVLPSPVYTDKNGHKWYNYDNITAKVEFSDLDTEDSDASGIGLAEISTDKQSSTYEIDKETDESAVHSMNLSVTSVKDDVKGSENGKLVFNASMYDLALNYASAQATVYVDTKAPEVTGFMVDGKNIKGNFGSYVHYSNSKVTVRLTAVDQTGAYTGASLVSDFIYTLHDVNGRTVTYTVKATQGSNNTAYADIEISTDFKGYITAVAVDNVGNKSVELKSEGIIVESQSKHNSSSAIRIELPESSASVNGAPLYNSDPNVKIYVDSTYAGVDKVEYEIRHHGGTTRPTSTFTTTSRDKNLSSSVSDSMNVSFNSNDIELIVTLTDKAGNKSTRSVKFSIDKTAPTISVVYDNNSYNTAYSDKQYFNANRTATITVTERNFDPSKVAAKIQADTGLVPSISEFTTITDSNDPDNTKHTATVTFSDDADYVFGLDLTDMAGNDSAHYGDDSFTIDKTAPKIDNVELSGIAKNGKYYNSKQTVTISLTEHNYDPALVSITAVSGTLPTRDKWTFKDVGGDAHTISFEVDDDDVYSFTVSLDDKARNNGIPYSQDQFVIDQTKPDAEITVIENGVAYGYDDTVDPDFVGKDVNLDRIDYTITKILANGERKDVTETFPTSELKSEDGGKQIITRSGVSLEKKEDFDGIYIFEATVTDLAGNSEDVTKTISVNRFGANFTITDETLRDEVINRYLSEGRDITINAINVTPITSEQVTITLNGEARTLTRGTDYTVSENNDGGWYFYSYTINKAVFETDGRYSVSISATDAEGNTSSSDNDAHENRIGDISFTIDKQSPVVTITGADDGISYKEQSKEITVKFEDKNFDTSDYEEDIHIFVNNKELTSSEYEEVASETGSGVITVRFAVTENDAEVVAYAKDPAGNESEHATLRFRLDQNWLQRLINNNKGLFVGGIAGIAAIIALIIFIIIKKKK